MKSEEETPKKDSKKKPSKKPESDPTEDEDDAKPANDSAAMEEEFTSLDANDDGILSGKEMASCKARDANSDGEVTLAEYLAGDGK